MPQNTAVAPVIISLNVETSFRKDKNLIEMLTLPQHIFTLFECVKSCSEAGKHGSNLILPYTGEQLCPLQHRNKLFHIKSFLL